MSSYILNKQNFYVFRNNTGLMFFNIIETPKILFLVFKGGWGLRSQHYILEVTIITELQKLYIHDPHICLKQLSWGADFTIIQIFNRQYLRTWYLLSGIFSKIKCLVFILQIMLSKKQYIVNSVYFIGQTLLLFYWTYLTYHSGSQFLGTDLGLFTSGLLLYSGPYLTSYFIH